MLWQPAAFVLLASPAALVPFFLTRGGFTVPVIGLGRETGASRLMAVLDVAGTRSRRCQMLVSYD
jgi:hypothetical protein